MTVIDEDLAELHRLNDGEEVAETPEPEVQAAETQAVAPPPPAAPAKRVITLDDEVELPDDDAIAPTFRRGTLSALVEDRKNAIRQRDEIGKLKNDFESENLVLKRLNEILVERERLSASASQAPRPEPPPRAETSEELIRREGIDAALGADPALALGRTLDIAGERSAPQIDEKIRAALDPLNATIEQLKQRNQQRDAEALGERIRAAHRQAGQFLKRDVAEWTAEANLQEIGAAVEFLKLPQDDAQSYILAEQWNAFRKAGSQPPAPPAPTQPAPVTAVQAAPAPPVGAGPAAAAVQPKVTKLNVRDMDAARRVAKLMDLPVDIAEQLAADAMNLRPDQNRSAAR